MVRVLHLIKALGRGGAEVLLVEGLSVANRDYLELSYAYLQRKPDTLLEDLKSQDAPVHCFDIGTNAGILLGVSRVARFLRENDISLVHAHLPMAGIVARLAGRLAGVPVVYTEHGPVDRHHPAVRALHRLTWPLVSYGIAVSPDVAESMVRVLGDGVPIRTVYNGVNVSKFDPTRVDGAEVRKRLGIPGDALVVGTVAVFRDTPQKRLDIWLEAARRVADEFPEAHFLLVGDGPLKERLKAQAEALRLVGGSVHFVGRQSDVRPFLAAMDVFMMSSAYEGFGVAPVEAMAMAVPVVATNIEGIRNVIAHEKTGLLAEFDNAVARRLAGLVVQLLRNPHRRHELAAAGRRSVQENFSIERMQRDLEEIYRLVLEGRERW